MALQLQDTPIRRKLMTVILLTSSVVLFLTCACFITYDVVTLRSELKRTYDSRASIIAANCSGALAFQNSADAEDVLNALSRDPQTEVACIYDATGEVFASYPPKTPASAFPTSPEKPGNRFEGSNLIVFAPVMQGDRMLGTVYLRANLSSLSDRYQAYLILVLAVIGITLFAAYILSQNLQKRISTPILALAETAKAISTRRDFSVRAPKLGRDELGSLTDAFNQMLDQIHEQTQALRESEARVRAVLDSAVSSVVVIDSAGKVIDWNERAEKMFGWTRQEALGQELAKMIVPERYREMHRSGMEQFKKTGKGPVLNRIIEMSAQRRDGSEFPVELSISPLKAGNTVSFCGFITDITERRRAEEVRLRMSAIVQSSDDAIISKTLDGRITSWNPGAEKLLGYTAEEAVGHPMSMAFPPDKLKEEEEILARVARGESIDHYETTRIRKDGKRVEVSVTISPIRDADGNVTGASKIARDITEQKLASRHEAAFAKLAQKLSAVTSATAAARVIADTADQLIGWDACSLDLYEQDEDLVHPIINIDTINGRRIDVPAAYTGQKPSAIVRKVLEFGGQLILREQPAFEEGAVPFGNTARPSASLMFVPMRRGEKVIGVLSIQSYAPSAYSQKTLNTLQTLADQCAGALERIRAEETLRQVNLTLERRVQERTGQLEAANKELEAFSYSVSHDLRAPLRHIAGFSELLRQEPKVQGDATVERFLNSITGAAKRMGSLIDDLLVFSRMGRAGIRRTTVDMNELVAEVIREMSNDFEGRNIAWDIEQLPTVFVDRPMFKQVWFNLISNAVKYTRQRERAEIHIKSRTNEVGYTEFSVRDNGAGFDMEYADKLFGVFQRLHHAEEFEGTGIGLANVRRIVLRHGGQTWAEGKVDAGATFYFSVPPDKDDKA